MSDQSQHSWTTTVIEDDEPDCVMEIHLERKHSAFILMMAEVFGLPEEDIITALIEGAWKKYNDRP